MEKKPSQAHGLSPTNQTPLASRCEMTQIIMPGQTNGAAGTAFGGVIMQWIDVCCGVSAMRHARGAVVTASVDRLDFIVPVRLGQVVVLQSQVNFVHRTSMEVGCRVETEDPFSGLRLLTTKAYFTFVAVDLQGKPRNVPRLALENELDRRRFEAAKTRRIERLRAAGKENR